MSDLLTPVDLICRECGDVYRSDQGSQHGILIGSGASERAADYTDPPYNWQPSHGLCLACWLVPGWHHDRRPEDDPERN